MLDTNQLRSTKYMQQPTKRERFRQAEIDIDIEGILVMGSMSASETTERKAVAQRGDAVLLRVRMSSADHCHRCRLAGRSK
jgi:hypothetical protein